MGSYHLLNIRDQIYIIKLSNKLIEFRITQVKFYIKEKQNRF